jgi:hypothetical protein
MRPLLVVLGSFLLAGPLAGQTAPAKPAPTAKSAAKEKKEEPPPKIEGITIPRGKGFLGLQLVEGTFKLSFYDEKKKPAAVDVARAALRWDPPYKRGREFVVLTPGADGKSLSSPRIIRPPHNFKLFITLLRDGVADEDPAAETFVIDFQA